jgi:high-affinity iron transporter
MQMRIIINPSREISMTPRAWFYFIGCVLCVAGAPAIGRASAVQQPPSVAQSILHTLDYVAVDYPHAVRNGNVTDADEYAEQREFAQQLQTLLERLPDTDNTPFLRQRARALVAAVEQRASAERIQTLCSELSSTLITTYNVPIAPTHSPTLQMAGALFQTHCTGCHGQTGFGDGPAASTLHPPPSNFHDRERQSQRSIYGLYSTITLGVEGTAMPSFAHLSADDRWSLAFYVSHFLATDAERARGQQLWRQGAFHELFANLGQLTQATPAAMAAHSGDDAQAVLAYLRSAPEQLTSSQLSPLALSRAKLDESLTAYRAGDQTRAYELAATAYLEGFELVEVSLNAVDADLQHRIETRMGHYRQAIKQHVPADDLAAQAAEIQLLLERASHALHSTTLSPTMGFTGAVIILVREGMEAILVLAAILAFLTKIDRRDVRRYVHFGWIAALALGVVTWLVAKYLINLGGADREITEGLTALFATAMLMYVGFWLHNSAHTQRWQSFIHSKVQSTLSRGTVWSLAAISFVAVYREAVETILFYETLWLQSASATQSAIILGFVGAALLLVVLAWAIFRLSIRLPFRLFFRLNAALLFVLAVVFAGKGIAALQEAGKLPVNPIDIPRIAMLGIYPTLESLGLQLTLVCLTLIWLGYQSRQDRQQNMRGLSV